MNKFTDILFFGHLKSSIAHGMEKVPLICAIFCFGVIFKLSECAPPTLWTTPTINTLNGSATLAQTLSETHTVGTLLGSVTINNVPTAYEILSQSYEGMFNVTFNSNNGDIYLINNTFLDYETDTSVTVIIKGSNSEGFGVATITITLVDANDNTPTFSASSYLVYIASTFANDSSIYTVIASDTDSTTNNDISYIIASGDDTTARFSIGARSGVVKRTGESFASNRYMLVIRATDGGGTARTGTTTLTVCIDCSAGVPVMQSMLVLVFGLLMSRMLGTKNL